MKQALLYPLLLLSINIFSQNALAELKFEEAETAFNNGDYELTIQKAGEFENTLGGITDKSLYLRLVSQSKLFNAADFYTSEKQFTLYNSLAENIAKYLKATENNGLDDKFKEVYAIGENLKKLNLPKDKTIWKKEQQRIEKEELDRQNAKLEQLELAKKTFEEFTIDDLPFGQTIEEFQKQHPDILPENYKMSKTKWAAGTEQDLIYACHSKSIGFESKENFLLPYNSSTGAPIYDTSIHLLLVKNGRIAGFQKTIFYCNSKGQGSLTYPEAVSQTDKYVEEFKAKFQSYGNKAADVIPYYGSQNQWSWIIPDIKSVHLYSDCYMDEKNPKRWKSSLTLRVFKN
ncbi:hypothetical protein J2Y38_004663 [Flavobacterium sp. 2755]|uniref:hypothetical protein n=1 Tax=Flavobacterium sp. 2755 TaxID=2817765 RepID=UPI00285ADD4A|nr:hypothetical protein [Flavobacterium sp. 2755]MDR6764430.1 hypothetical protein [Flavobacterium sp. 2755]